MISARFATVGTSLLTQITGFIRPVLQGSPIITQCIVRVGLFDGKIAYRRDMLWSGRIEII